MNVPKWISHFSQGRTLLMLICIMLSAFFWVSNKLSLTYSNRVSVRVRLTDIPYDRFLPSDFFLVVDLDVSQQGYSFLKYRFLSDKYLNFNWLKEVDEGEYQWSEQGKEAFKSHFFPYAKSFHLITNRLKIPFQKRKQKVLPVKLLPFTLDEKGYTLTQLTISPDSISVWGAENVVDTLSAIYLDGKSLMKKSSFFEEKYLLKSTDFLKYNDTLIRVSGVVSRVTEQELWVVVRLKNVPIGARVRVFPSTVEVLCLGSIHLLKDIKSFDVKVVADYLEAKNGIIPLKIYQKPDGVNITFISEDKVEYLTEYK